MNVYVCTDHDGFWPVGVASVIVAGDEADARGLLMDALRARKLNPYNPKFTLQKLDLDTPKATILLDGDY